MVDYLRNFLTEMQDNLNILLEREANYAGNAPVDLLNQINHHRKAMVFVEQTIADELNETELLEALKPLLVSEGLKERLALNVKHDKDTLPQTLLTRKQVEQVVRSSRGKGERPNLREAELIKVDLLEADLAEVDLSKANLSFSDLEQANLEKAKLVRANLRGARLHRTHLKDADLKRAELKDANLFRPTLTGADLSEVDLSKAKVDLEGADLKNAKLFETNLEGINLRGAILTGAEYSGGTKWPKNFDPKRAGAILRVSCNKYGIKIKRPQTGYVIKEIGNVDIKVIGVYTEKPSDHYLCIIVANKDRNRFWLFPERIVKEFNEDSKEWSVVVPFGESNTGYYEVTLLAALVAKEDFAEGEYSSLPLDAIICHEVRISKGSNDRIGSNSGLTQPSRWRRFSNK